MGTCQATKDPHVELHAAARQKRGSGPRCVKPAMCMGSAEAALTDGRLAEVVVWTERGLQAD